MKRFDLSEADVKQIIGTQLDGTGVRWYMAILQDGRRGKARVEYGVIADAFIVH